MKILFLLCSVILCGCLVYGEDDEKARIIASKHILNQYLVEGRDITVEYHLYNIGSNAALQVNLVEEGFSDVDFERMSGLSQVYWERIAPGSNVTHAVIVKPMQSGLYNFSHATVTYLPSENANDQIVSYTSAPGEGEIVGVKEFDRRFSPHFLDWAVFAVMTLPSLGIPFLLWYKSKMHYDPSGNIIRK